MSELENREISPMNYLKIFFRRKGLIIMCTLIGLILGICACILLPREYISSSIMLVEEGKSDNPLFDKLAVASTIEQRLTGIKESMLGWYSMVKLVKRLGLDKDVKTPHEFENLILGIRNKVKIGLRGKNIISVSYEGENPEKIYQIVKNISEIFIERNIEKQNEDTSDAIAFIEDELKLYKGKIKSAEIAKLKDELTTLLTDSTEKHPRVKQLKEAIAQKQAELRKENLEYTENVDISDTKNNPIINEIKNALTSLQAKTSNPVKNVNDPKDDLTKVMLINTLDNVLARDIEVNQKIYNMLLERLETAKITQNLQSSQEGTRYTVLDPPRIPLSPVKPNKLLVILMGVIGGSGSGIGIVFLLAFLDRSFIDVEEAKHFLGVPLLGAISRINTIEQIHKEKQRMAWMYGITIIGGALCIIVSIAASNFLK